MRYSTLYFHLTPKLPMLMDSAAPLFAIVCLLLIAVRLAALAARGRVSLIFLRRLIFRHQVVSTPLFVISFTSGLY